MHYANGREAHVGDPVVGKVYNTPGIIAGTLVSLTPGPDACSAQVEWIAVTGKGGEAPRMAAHDRVVISRGREQHGSAGELVDLYVCRDYTHAGNLVHADDARQAVLVDVPMLTDKVEAFIAADHPAAADQA